jgi:hypothetical protein
MKRYRLEYVETRKLIDGKIVNIPVEQFEYIPLDIVTEDYNKADRLRCELCSAMNYGFVQIIEEE